MALDATEMAPSEWEVMRVVWSTHEPATRTIVTALQEKRDWSESTIKTLLARLVKKGMLSAKRVGHGFVYAPQIAETPAMNQTVAGVFDHLCAMKKGTVISELVTNTTLSRADIVNLQAVLAAKLTTAPETVACDCMPAGE